MALEDNFCAPVRIFVPIIDCSDGMAEKMGRLNEGMEEALERLRLIAADSSGVFSVAPIAYATGAEWLSKNGLPISVHDFIWTGLPAGGRADFGAALRALSEKLTFREEGGWLDRQRQNVFVYPLLLSGTPATDDYRAELNKLNQNRLFRATFRLAIPIGSDADREMLTAFTGNAGSVMDMEAYFKNFEAFHTILWSLDDTSD